MEEKEARIRADAEQVRGLVWFGVVVLFLLFFVIPVHILPRPLHLSYTHPSHHHNHNHNDNDNTTAIPPKSQYSVPGRRKKPKHWPAKKLLNVKNVRLGNGRMHRSSKRAIGPCERVSGNEGSRRKRSGKRPRRRKTEGRVGRRKRANGRR